MKKRILLFISLISAILCIFAISASAKDRKTISYTDVNGVTHSVPVVKFDDATASNVASAIKSGDSRGHHCYVEQTEMVMDNGAYVILADSNGELTAYPTWYILDITSSSGNPEIYEVGYGYINSKSEETGKTYTDGATRYVEFPEGLLTIRNNGVWGRSSHYEPNVTEFVIPDTVTTIAGLALSYNKNLHTVHISESNNLQVIGDDAFANNTSLVNFDFTKLTKLTSIDGFNGCTALSTPDLSKTQLTTIGNSTFNGCTNFTGDLDLSMLPLKTIGEKAFYDCKIGKLTLPDSLESIGSFAFYGPNFHFASPYLPKSLTSLGQQFICGTSKLNELIIFPEGVTQLVDEELSGCSIEDTSKTLTLVFLGEMTRVWVDGKDYPNVAAQINLYFAKNSLDDVKAKVYAFTDKEAGTLGDVLRDNISTGTLDFDVSSRSPNSTTKVGSNFMRLIFCEDNNVEVSYVLTVGGRSGNLTDSITEDRGDFIDINDHTHYTPAIPLCNAPSTCIVCEVLQTVDHVNGETIKIEYSNGYANVGDTTYACSVCKESVKRIGDAVAIFKASGYSIKESTGDALIGGYTINEKALLAYNKYADNPLVYGIVMSNGLISSGGLTFDNENKLTSSLGIQLQATETGYARLNYTIRDFDITSENATIELVIALYVVDNSGISFIQGDSSSNETQATTQKGTVALKTITFKKTAELLEIYDKLIEATKVEAEIKE